MEELVQVYQTDRCMSGQVGVDIDIQLCTLRCYCEWLIGM